MSIELEKKDLINTQQMEVAVNGPDGATHLILCTGVANLDSVLVGPQLSRRQFVGVIACAGLATFQADEQNNTIVGNANRDLGVNLVLIYADFDEKSCQVQVSAEVSSSIATTKLAVSYSVSILAELPSC
ncbi:MAG TPA: hypothetical protein VK909_12115 [Anaerolineales bacterium]|nr:hypothetical protein [Anaerolineales bacterium]